MTSNNKVMVYDDNCPLCNAYTNAFVKMGLLETQGRQAFSEATGNIMCRLDAHKSRNEIPLLDTKTNQTWYGLDAMLEVISIKYPLVKKVANVAPIKWLLQRLYKLISYNRKVIVAVPKSNSGFDCTPDFNKKYRLLFIALVSAFCYLFFAPIIHLIGFKLFDGSYVFTGIILGAVLLPMLFAKSILYHYFGQIAMLALLTILLFLPILICNYYFAFSLNIKRLYALLVLGFIVKEAIRRSVYLASIKELTKRPLAQLK